MDKKELHLTIVSPEKTLFNGNINWVELPGEKGRFQVLNNHAALISTLVKGNIVYELGEAHYRVKRESHSIQISSGFVEIQNNVVSVCVETSDKEE